MSIPCVPLSLEDLAAHQAPLSAMWGPPLGKYPGHMRPVIQFALHLFMFTLDLTHQTSSTLSLTLQSFLILKEQRNRICSWSRFSLQLLPVSKIAPRPVLFPSMMCQWAHSSPAQRRAGTCFSDHDFHRHSRTPGHCQTTRPTLLPSPNERPPHAHD